MDPKTPRERLRETLEATRREKDTWPQYMKDAPSFFESRSSDVDRRSDRNEPER